MAKGTSRRHAKTNVSFGKDAEVICKKEGSTHEGEKGIIVTGEANKEGEFEVRFVGESGRTEYEHIHGNDLDVAVDPDAGYTVSVNGRPMGSISDAVKEMILGSGRPYIITKAAIKDDYCYYSLKIISGPAAGEQHDVTIDNIIHPDLARAFERLNVHLAIIDDAYNVAGVEIKDIDMMHGHDLTLRYFVTGFESHGGDSDESVSLTGSKHLSVAHSRMKIPKTPKIPLDNLSSYQWYNELKAAIDTCREEVALYKEGKYEAPPEEVVKKKKGPKQLTIGDQLDGDDKEQSEASDEEKAEVTEEFGNAEV